MFGPIDLAPMTYWVLASDPLSFPIALRPTRWLWGPIKAARQLLRPNAGNSKGHRRTAHGL